jgi:hypothetical protein
VDPREKERLVRMRLRDSLPYYGPRCLKIMTKKDEHGRSYPVPFEFNSAQQVIHERLEAQKAAMGWVRAIILKGRQQGCSTYVQARFFHKTTMNRGEKTFILTHQAQATDNLFDMTKRYYDNAPPFVQPRLGRANSQEMIFDGLDSSYQVATAGSKGAGRSATLTNVHGSEVAFWENGEEHLTGLFQAVALAKGTEIILESTANGFGNVFQKQWEMAARGESDFIAIFVPWFLQTEYRRPVPDDFELDGNPESVPDGELTEVEYAEAFKLDNAQMYWRRMKIRELGGGEEGFFGFKQEYPATPDEAFQKSNMGSLLSRRSVLRARKSDVATPGPLIIGVDPAGDGDNADRTTYVRRRTRKIFGIERHTTLSIPQHVRRLHAIIKAEKPTRVNIDVGGIGLGLYQGLIELEGTRGIVYAVNFGEAAMDPTTYANRKAEMAWALQEWIEDPGGANIPDEDDVQADFLATPPDEPDSNSRKRLKPKKWVRKTFGRSTDIFDAAILTFATPVDMGSMVIGNAMTEFDPFSGGYDGGAYVGNAMPDLGGWD